VVRRGPASAPKAYPRAGPRFPRFPAPDVRVGGRSASRLIDAGPPLHFGGSRRPSAPRSYFFNGSGRTAVSGRAWSVRPEESAITTASGTVLNLNLMASLSMSRGQPRLPLRRRQVRQLQADVFFQKSLAELKVKEEAGHCALHCPAGACRTLSHGSLPAVIKLTQRSAPRS
jgi:hypothetical protein